jgi:hypothetical protein
MGNWLIMGDGDDFGRHLRLNSLIEGGLVATREQIREKKLNILLG